MNREDVIVAATAWFISTNEQLAISYDMDEMKIGNFKLRLKLN